MRDLLILDLVIHEVIVLAFPGRQSAAVVGEDVDGMENRQ